MSIGAYWCSYIFPKVCEYLSSRKNLLFMFLRTVGIWHRGCEYTEQSITPSRTLVTLPIQEQGTWVLQPWPGSPSRRRVCVPWVTATGVKVLSLHSRSCDKDCRYTRGDLAPYLGKQSCVTCQGFPASVCFWLWLWRVWMVCCCTETVGKKMSEDLRLLCSFLCLYLEILFWATEKSVLNEQILNHPKWVSLASWVTNSITYVKVPWETSLSFGRELLYCVSRSSVWCKIALVCSPPFQPSFRCLVASVTIYIVFATNIH